ncbi:MAG: hypothetical protein GXO90_11945 [FCB group bacterium]|nr:hypothetical protein [FCB group bacterium]
MTVRWLHGTDFWFWMILVLVSGALIWGFRKGRRMPWFSWLLTLRILIFGSLLIGLFQPRIRTRQISITPLKWNIYVDNSISMGYHQNPSLVSLRNGVQDLLHTWEKTTSIDIYQFSRDVKQIDTPGLEADGSATDLGKVLRHIRSESNELAGAIIITDGQITQGEDPADLVRDLSIPVFTLGVGDSSTMVDVAIKSIDVPTVAVKGEPVDAGVILSNTGTGENRLNVSLYSRTKMLGSRFVSLSGGGAQTQVKFRFTPEAIGPSTYRVQVSTLPDEVNIENNRQSFDITVLKDRYNVAVITGSPGFNTGVIKALLTELPRVHLDHYVQIGNEFRPPLKSFWETPYELIVFENFPTEPLPRTWQRILARKIVAQHSSLAWFGGPDMDQEAARGLYPFFYIQSMGDVLEESSDYALSFTDWIQSLSFLASFSKQVDLRTAVNFPPVHPGLQIEGTRNDQWVLAELASTLSIPALLIGEKEALRYAVWTPRDLAALHYKLIGSPDQAIVDGFIQKIFSWLMKTSGDNDMYFRLNKTSFQQGELISVMGNRIAPAGPDARALVHISKDGVVINTAEMEYQAEKDRWEGELYAPSPGRYFYEVVFQEGGEESRETGEFRVQESQVELNQVVLNADVLKSISKKTNGTFYLWKNKTKLNDVVEDEQRKEIKHSEWGYMEHPWVWTVIILFFAGEWILRRTLGLP